MGLELFISCLWLAIAAGLILRAMNQRGLWQRVPRAPLALAAETVPYVTFIVPARDEEANIERCVISLLAQDYPAERLSVLVIDDHSADATVAVVRRIAATHPRLGLLHCPPLPPRWTGKSHACWIGARAVASHTEWLCFVDADVWGGNSLLSNAMRTALDRQLDLLSLAPRQELGSFAERLILPCGLILLSFIQNLRRLQASSRSETTATGQFMLIRRTAYEEIGGHAAVASSICEDLEIARLLKRQGSSVLLMSGEEVLSTRMYTGWSTLWPGLSKNLVDTLGGRRSTLALAVSAVLLAWSTVAIPTLDALSWAAGRPWAAVATLIAAAASTAIFGLHVAATFYFRIPFWYGLLSPLGYTIGAIMAADSVRRRITGRIAWKGRMYS